MFCLYTKSVVASWYNDCIRW